MADPVASLAFEDHDHGACLDHALRQAKAVAKGEGLRLTPVRLRTLEILLEAHQAMGAYEVLEKLASDGFAKQPPVAYRALEFLVEHGFAHRIRRLNAFAACMHPGEEHAPVFLICSGCGQIAESPGDAVAAALRDAAKSAGFSVERANFEAVGLCSTCQEVA